MDGVGTVPRRCRSGFVVVVVGFLCDRLASLPLLRHARVGRVSFLDCSPQLDLRGAVSQTRLAVIGTIYRDLAERAFSQTCALYGPF